MASINDYKMIRKISLEYFKFLDTNLNNLEDNDKARLGFYLFILECITGNKSIDELKYDIIDTHFRKIIFKEDNNDLGVDAVYIDDEARKIMLFNFKYRDKFNCDKTQSLNDAIDCSKFLNVVCSKNVSNLGVATENKIYEIIQRYDSYDEWETELVLVSNENKPVDINKNEIQSFMDMYGLTLKSITLDDIVSFISIKPRDVVSKFILDKDAVIVFEEDNFSSSKSYLVRLPLVTLIRISCKSEEMRLNANLNDFSKLEYQDLEMSLLYDNVRGYLGDTKFNKNIIKTIEQEPSKFFMYNNGITITSKNIVTNAVNAKAKLTFELHGFQIVNGGQTIKSIYRFLKEKFDEEKLLLAQILVRIFKTEDDVWLTNSIAEYTNSQNAISATDLRSIDKTQVKLEEYLGKMGIKYVRKVGDIGFDKYDYTNKISMEVLAQIIYSKMGNPDKATNQKKALFEKNYNEIFHEDMDFDLTKQLIDQYFDIVNQYEKMDFTNQKAFYVIFIINNYSKSIAEAIKIVETSLKGYRADENISDARKLIQSGFKAYITNIVFGSEITRP